MHCRHGNSAVLHTCCNITLYLQQRAEQLHSLAGQPQLAESVHSLDANARRSRCILHNVPGHPLVHAQHWQGRQGHVGIQQAGCEGLKAAQQVCTATPATRQRALLSARMSKRGTCQQDMAFAMARSQWKLSRHCHNTV